jgi:hypothetical protein
MGGVKKKSPTTISNYMNFLPKGYLQRDWIVSNMTSISTWEDINVPNKLLAEPK